DAVDGLLGPGEPAVALREADAQVCARADEAKRGERMLVEGRGALPEPLDVLAPGLHRVRLVEAGGGGDRVPQPLDVGLAEHGPRPPLVGVADDRPLDEAPVLRVEELLDGEPRPCGLRAALVEVGEELGLGVACDRDRRPAGLDLWVDHRDRAWRAPVERAAGSWLDARALEMVVAVEHLHVPRPALVRDPADGPDQRKMLRVRRYPEERPRLEVDGHPDRKAGVPVEPLRRTH